MKKNVIVFAIMAVLPLLFSCAKENAIDTDVQTLQENPDPWTVVALNRIPIKNGNLSVNASAGTGTKTHLTPNASGAGVEWTAGDTFLMIGVDGLTNRGETTYSATTGGAVVSFTGGATISGATCYHSIYPSTALTGLADYYGNLAFGVNIPTVQTATANNIAEGVNLSYAQSATQDEDLHFKNIVSYIKFRLTGSVVPSIKSVSFRSTCILSGDVIFLPNSSGEPEILDGLSFSSLYSEVSLNGTFATDTDYYIAVAPCALDSFSMVFANEDGTQTITKISSKSFVLNRSRIADLGTINLGDSFDASNSIATLYMEHSTAKYATIAVIPDGYTQSELAQYEIDARSGIDALFNTEPYKSYKSYFNVWILKIASKESGARISDGTVAEQNRDCYFQSSWGNDSYGDMQANPYRVFDFVSNYCPDVADGSHSIKDVPVLIIINDNRYGGIAWNYGSGQTYCMVPTSFGGSSITWSYPSTEAASVDAVPGNTRSVTDGEKASMGINSGTWRNTLVHEFGGHSIGKLGDEYWYNSYESAVEAIASHSWPVPMSLNVSAKSGKSEVPWAAFFDGDNLITSLNTAPYNERIGVFQGADVSMFNRWRSERISCMIDNRFYFSTWQRYIIANRIMTLAGLPLLSLSEFLSHDVPTDPVRDGGSPTMRPDGVSDRVPPRPVPMLPPPRYVEVAP